MSEPEYQFAYLTRHELAVAMATVLFIVWSVYLLGTYARELAFVAGLLTAIVTGFMGMFAQTLFGTIVNIAVWFWLLARLVREIRRGE